MIGIRLKRWLPAILIVGYVATVLIVDTLAVQGSKLVVTWNKWPPITLTRHAPLRQAADQTGVADNAWVFDFSRFRWRLSNGFDVFKFLAWFAIPFVCCAAWMDWQYLTFKRWKPLDTRILITLALLGAAAIFAMRFFPSLDQYYPGMGYRPWGDKWAFIEHQAIWIFSWLVGWEFLHRYVLLTHFGKLWPRVGWLIVPVSEGLYHLQKPLPETAAMVVFSIILTLWVMKRRNVLVSFFAHLIIEIELVAYLVLT